jgi:hypothetical protein
VLKQQQLSRDDASSIIFIMLAPFIFTHPVDGAVYCFLHCYCVTAIGMAWAVQSFGID